MNEKTQVIPLFHPTFGSRPEQIVGREQEIQGFLAALDEPIGSCNRCTFFLGQRGMGKTVLLLELEDLARAKNYVVARVTAQDSMPETIIEQIQIHGSKYVQDEKRKVKGVSAGILGFSFGLTFSEVTQTQYGFRTKLTLLCDKLAEYNKGVLILVDEVQTSEAMRIVASAYQELVGERKNIAIAMAGLPYAVSDVLNDKVLTFLNRAHKVVLGPISIQEIRAYFSHACNVLNIEASNEHLDDLAAMTKGLPYLMQLVGYYLVQYTQDNHRTSEAVLKQVERAALADLDDNVFKPMLAPLSENDRTFLAAMAQDEVETTTADLQLRFNGAGPAIQPYRRRLIDAGLIESPRKGVLVFAVPLLREYILKEDR